MSLQATHVIATSQQLLPNLAPNQILVVASKANVRNRLVRALRSVGVEVLTCDTAFAADRLAVENPVQLVICQLPDNWSMADLTALPAVTRRVSTIFLSNDGRTECLADLCDTMGMHSMAALLGDADATDLLRAARKILQHNLFGIEKYLDWGTPINSVQLTTSDERRDVLEKVTEYMLHLQCGGQSINRALSVSDEFLMNGLYDAPTDASGHHVHVEVPRAHTVQLPDDQTIQFTFGCDGRNMALSCVDPYGSLDVQRVARCLGRGLRAGDDQINQGDAGAGLGVYMAYQFLDHLVINVEPTRRTEFIGLIGTQAGAKKVSKSFNLFVA